jgi:membrane protein implicated in regulation of membrane protease activity
MADYWHVILITFVGFVALAAILLVPVWRFLSKEEETADGFSKAVGTDASGAGPAWMDQLSGGNEAAEEESTRA